MAGLEFTVRAQRLAQRELLHEEDVHAASDLRQPVLMQDIDPLLPPAVFESPAG